MEEAAHNSEIPEATEAVVERSIDEELADSRTTLARAMSDFESLDGSVGGPLGEYHGAANAMRSWMAKQIANLPDLPLSSAYPYDQKALDACEQKLFRIEAELISKKSEHKQLQEKARQLISNSLGPETAKIKDYEQCLEHLWQSFNDAVKACRLKLREFHWVEDLRKNIDEAANEIPKVEEMLGSLEESRRKTHDDKQRLDGDVAVTGIIVSSSLLDEWYNTIVLVEESLREVQETINNVAQSRKQNKKYRLPDQLSARVDEIVNASLPTLKNRIQEVNAALAHDRRISRWFDTAADTDRWISESLNRAKILEVPDFIYKSDWADEEQNLESIVHERRKIIEGVAIDAEQFRHERTNELESKSKDFIAETADSTNSEDPIVVDMMTKQLANLNERFTKFTDFITLLLTQTTTERYRVVVRCLMALQALRVRMQNMRKSLAEHNDAALVQDELKAIESEVTAFEQELPEPDSELFISVRQRHAKLLLTIQNIRAAVEEGRLQMAAYLSPSSPSSPTSASSDFDRLGIQIQDRLESFHVRLIPRPTYMLDTSTDHDDEPEPVHGLTCNDDHIEELTERYGSIESELVSFERTLWVEFWLKSERAKRVRANEVKDRIDELEHMFVEIKDLMELRKHDLALIREGREFAKRGYAIRDVLDIVKNKMRRGQAETTTDATLQEFDERLAEAQSMLDALEHTHPGLLAPEFEDERYREALKNLHEQYEMVQAWIEEVRIWFMEAERIRIWIENRIDVLDNVPQVDPFQEGPAPCTQEQVDEWQKDHENLEKEIATFSEEDMVRLKQHVKELVDAQYNSANTMSPAETMTISITLKTLHLMDQLMNQMKNRDTEIACLDLRVQFEREFERSLSELDALYDELKTFTQQKARWKPPVSQRDDGWLEPVPQTSQKEVSTEALRLDRKIEELRNGAIKEAGQFLDELCETANVPEHLLMKQENLEDRDHPLLQKYKDFCNEVIVQRKDCFDYCSDAESSYKEGMRLKAELIKEEEKPRGGSVERKFVSRVEDFNARVQSIWNNKGSQVLYPVHTRHEQSENAVVQEGIETHHKRLCEAHGEVDEALKAYQRALRFVKMAEEYKKEAARLQDWIDKQNKLLVKRKVDVFVKTCKHSRENVNTYIADNSQLGLDVASFETQDLQTLHQKVAALVAEVKAIGTKCVNTDELDNMMATLDSNLGGLHDNIETHTKELAVLDKRVEWEDKHRESDSWIEGATKEAQDFFRNKARWHEEDRSSNEVMVNWLATFNGTIPTFKDTTLKSTQNAFNNMCDIFTTLPNVEEAPAHLPARQESLEAKVTKLETFTPYIEEVLGQRKAVLDYMDAADEVETYGSQLRDDLNDALTTLITPDNHRTEEFVERIATYKEKIVESWNQFAEVVPYPARKDTKDPTAEDANDAKFNKSVRESLKKKDGILKTFGQNLDQMLLDYQKSLELQARAIEYTKEAERLQEWIRGQLQDLKDREVDPLGEQCPWTEDEVHNMQQVHDEFLRVNARVDVEDVSELRRSLENLLKEIAEANCKNIDQASIRETLDNLNKNFAELQSASSARSMDLLVLETRTKWEEQHAEATTLLADLTKEVNDFIADQARWLPDRPEPEKDLQETYAELGDKVSTFGEKTLATTKSMYNDLESAIKTYLSKETPEHISARHDAFKQQFDDLESRLALAKQVLEQRDAVKAYFAQADSVQKEGEALKAHLADAEANGEADPGFKKKVAAFEKSLDSLRKDVADKIPYPEDALMPQDLNAEIKQVVDARLAELDYLSSQIGSLHDSYQNTMSLVAELVNALDTAKKIEGELDKFIFERAAWESERGKDVSQNPVDSVISKLLAELDSLNQKVADFETGTLNPVNAKFDEYKTTMEGGAKSVPAHVQSHHKAVNDLLDALKQLDGYAKDVIAQRKTVMEYMKDGAKLEEEASQIQKILISSAPSSPSGEGNTMATVVSGFEERVQALWDDFSAKITYPSCSAVNEDRVHRAEDSNNVIQGAVDAQNESLKSLAHGLGELLENHQNVLRRKKNIESYMSQADGVAAWITPRLEKLNSISNDDTVGELTEDGLRELIGKVEGIDAEQHAYRAFGFAKSMADQMIDEMAVEAEQSGEDAPSVRNDLEKVRAKQQELDALWDALQKANPAAKQVLEQGLQVLEFKECAAKLLAKVNMRSAEISSAPIETVTDDDVKEWQRAVNELESSDYLQLILNHDRVQENLSENKSAISDKESKKLESRLREVGDAIQAVKKLTSAKVDEVAGYRSSLIANAHIARAEELKRWIDNAISQFAQAQNHCIMVGNSEQQNKDNHDALIAVFEDFKKELPGKAEELESVRAEFKDIGQDIREVSDILSCQERLNTAWENLEVATAEIKDLIERVGQWHGCHEGIYRVEKELLDGLQERFDRLASISPPQLADEVKELEDRRNKANVMLEEVKVTANRIRDKPGNALDAQNRQNFDQHHADAVKRLKDLSASLQTALKAARLASALAAFHAETDRIIRACLEGKAVVQSRHDELERSDYYALEADAMGETLRTAIDSYTTSEETLNKHEEQVKTTLKSEADQLVEQNPQVKDRVVDIFNRVTGALGEFSDAVASEKQELLLVRAVFRHAKGAHDIKSWISSCKMAALNIQTEDIADQEAEIADLEDKVARFQSTVDEFSDMTESVLSPTGDDPDEPRPEEIKPKVEEAVRHRADRVLEDWNGLQDLLKSVRKHLKASKENLEVSRAIKDILLAIQQVKERVLNIESFTGDGIIRLPTVGDVQAGEHMLDEIQAEVDHILQPRIEGVDEMISNLTENDSGYVQHRAGIAEALTNLAVIIENKRNQLREAANIAEFGSKADEIDGLMSSVLEIVDAASNTSGSSLSSLPKRELQTRLTELSTKIQYYSPKIEQRIAEAKVLAEPVKDDWRVEERLGALIEQWNELKALANNRKDELKRLFSGQKVTPTPSRSRRTRSSTGLSPSRTNAYRRNSRVNSPSTPPASPTPGGSGGPRRPQIRLLPHSVNNYVPDPKDPLDVEVARIVNACPVKVKVAMVEGDPGKYQFGEIEPKLCYCRILRSRMVMVRVGGGWAELSKFLVEHANLEQKYIPKAQSFVRPDQPELRTAASSPSFHEAYIRIPPPGSGSRNEGEKGISPLALKHVFPTRKKIHETYWIWAIGVAVFAYFLLALKDGNPGDMCAFQNTQYATCT